MSMTKRIFAFFLALVWVLALSACGALGTGAPPPVAGTQPPSAATESGTPPVIRTPAVETEEPSASLETAQPESLSPEATEELSAPAETETPTPAPAVSEDGWYSSKEEVALYLHLYGHLPDNYVTKDKAEALGWTGGSVERYAGEGTAIGGSRFGNYEGLLPKAPGRTYTECDIGTVGTSSRGAKRLVYSNDGLIYYTEDHYESFELLYGEP